jgi:hypothetical protein
MRELGVAVPLPPSPEAAGIDELRQFWVDAGLAAVETREITVQRTFSDFDDYWTTIRMGPGFGPILAAMASEEIELLKMRMRARLQADATGRITCVGRANAVKGQVFEEGAAFR